MSRRAFKEVDHDRRRQLHERRAARTRVAGSPFGPVLQGVVIEPEHRGGATDAMPVHQPDGQRPKPPRNPPPRLPPPTPSLKPAPRPLQILRQLPTLIGILVAVEPADFRRGIDGLARLCQETLRQDTFAGAVFVFRNRKGTALKVLTYDGQGFWLCHKRLSQGRFPWWPSAAEGGAQRLAAHQLSVLLAAGDPTRTGAAADWRPVGPLT